jgi:hypothetical protein
VTTGPLQRSLPPVVSLTTLGVLGEQIATNTGQSSAVTRVEVRGTGPGLLFKRYKKPLDNTDVKRLDRLIAFGRSDAAAGRPAREVLLRHTSWPVTRVEDDDCATIGCLIPLAPNGFRTPTGGYREIDTLARSDERIKRNGTPPTPEQRITACRCLVGIAAALEQRRFVYSDWNYANAFWNPDDYTVYLIDMDGCAEDSGPDIRQHGWEDPLARPGAPADLYTDRYRVALLTGRCLTGERNHAEMLHRLADPPPGIPSGAAETLLDMLLAQDRDARPRSSVLLAVLNGGPAVRFPVVRSPLPKRPAARPEPTRTPLTTPVSKTGPSGSVTGPTPSPDTTNWAVVALFAALFLIVIIIAIASS